MWNALKAAACEGTLLGVKYGVALLILAAVLLLLAGDYNVVRERALNGQIAFEKIDRAEKQMAAQPAPQK